MIDKVGGIILKDKKIPEFKFPKFKFDNLSELNNINIEELKKVKNNSKYMLLSQKGTQISRQRLDQLMKHYCSGTHIPAEKQHFHVLKHTRAVELAEYGFDVDDIQYWLGHKSVQNTFIYLQYTTMIRKKLFIQLQKLEGGKTKKWKTMQKPSELLMKAIL